MTRRALVSSESQSGDKVTVMIRESRERMSWFAQRPPSLKKVFISNTFKSPINAGNIV